MATDNEYRELAAWIVEVSNAGGGEFVILDNGDEVSRAMVDEIQRRWNAGESLDGLIVDAPGASGA